MTKIGEWGDSLERREKDVGAHSLSCSDHYCSGDCLPCYGPVFYDQVDGAKLVEKVATGVLPSATAPADVDLAIVQNDDHAITAIHPESIMPNEIANVVSIDKQRRIFKVILIYFGNSDIVSNGACTRQ